MSKKNEGSESPEEISFGEFWQTTPKELTIHHEGSLDLLRQNGFSWIRIDDKKRLVRIIGQRVIDADITDVTDFMYQYIKTKVPEKIGHKFTRNDLLNLFVRGIDNYINYPKLRLLGIKEIAFHFDTKTESFFYFQNGVVRVTSDSRNLIDYSGLHGYVWGKQVRPYNVTLLPEESVTGDFKTFCFRVCNEQQDRFESLMSIIGYTLHRYWSPSLTVVPCFLDETITGSDEAMGGTGKTTICLALGLIRNMVDIDGRGFKPGGDFRFQRLDLDTEILFIDDLDRNTSFEFCFSIVSAGMEVNQKNKPAFKIPKERTPKFIITSNYTIKSNSGGYSTERRKVEVEVSPHYGAAVKPFDEFGREFFQDWNAEDYNQMFNFFICCTQLYLKRGIIQPPSINYELRKLISSVGIDLKEFLDLKILEGKDKLNKKDLHEEFLKGYTGLKDYYRSPHKFTQKIHKYLKFRDIPYRETPANAKRVIEMDLSGIPANDDDDEGG